VDLARPAGAKATTSRSPCPSCGIVPRSRHPPVARLGNSPFETGDCYGFHRLQRTSGFRKICAYIDEHNECPRPFVWTAKAEDILEKVRRAKAVLNKIASE
jgi:hypothetical protein